ncbi:CLUMA_CG013065, isoform A [Clunio marinus]|uniref:CLUMA_CG013065, isoform A n=1 Tax=Clunio marinus TaxID=568069 RepID=A0A1J1IHE2_9DIPT|nr:CLUMA_CG013065, isoform A [Clunio marinus]
MNGNLILNNIQITKRNVGNIQTNTKCRLQTEHFKIIFNAHKMVHLSRKVLTRLRAFSVQEQERKIFSHPIHVSKSNYLGEN